MSKKFLLKKPVFLFLLLTFVLLLSLGQPDRAFTVVRAAGPDADTLAKIEPELLTQLQREGEAAFFIWLTETADLNPASQFETKLEKGQFVYDALRATADRTQSELKNFLDSANVPYRSYYISNKILVQAGDYGLLLNLAARDDVSQVTANHQYQLPQPTINPKPGENLEAIESNILFVNADDVWNMGVNGEGTVVAGNDTGLDWDHPALINQYRGWDGAVSDHNYNWWDATRTYPNAPGDGHGHGTHTSGTMVGDDGGSNQIGMAPGARLIHCKNLTDFGSGDDAMVSECFQWSLAPWDLNGQNPRPDLAPDVINNSWGFGGGGVTFMQADIAALQAAGIVVEVSAGNDGPSCATLGSPGDYGEVLTTGSIDHASGTVPGTLSWFSSRGPSSLSAEYIPDIMAPGENIRSSVPGGGYEGGWSGTSMSGPHVTGLVSLMWSANPALRGFVAETAQLISDTAIPLSGQTGSNCGGDYTEGPNDDWGHGTIDALAAVQAAMVYGDPGTLTGTVTEAGSSAALANVVIKASLPPDLSWKRVTDENGLYSMLVFSGTYDVSANLYGYYPESFAAVQVTSFTTTTLDIELTAAPTYTVSGTVTDAVTGWPLYAAIRVIGFPGQPAWTDPETGAYSISLAAGIDYTFQITPWSAGYNTNSRVVPSLTSDQSEDFALQANLLACVAPGYQPEFVYFEDFEADEGAFTVAGTTTSWAWGEARSGPGVAFSGSNVWGTNLAGNYSDGESGYIVSPAIDLSSYAGQNVIVSWWQWLQTESGFDYATAEISNDGGASWNNYYWADGNASLGWTKQSVILDSSYAVSNFQIRFGLVSDFSITYPGFYVDDVGIGVAVDTPFLYSQDFELDDGAFLAAGSNSSWAWGIPTRGPGSANSGVNAWATALSGNYNNDETSQLSSPDIDLSTAAGEQILLTWYQWLQTESVYDLAAVEVSNDGGANWATLYGPLSGPVDTSWNRYSLILDSSYAVNNFRVRFALQSDDSVNYPGFYVDDIAIRVYSDTLPTVPCNAQAGGLVVGNVYDANTAAAVDGARVTHELGDFTSSQATPDDDALADGFYVLFSPSGLQELTASKDGYSSDSQNVTVPTSATVRLDFNLAAGLLEADPDNLAATLPFGGSTTTTFTLNNVGLAPTNFAVQERNGGFLPSRFVSTMPNRPLAANGNSVSKPAGYAATLNSSPNGGGDDPVCLFKDADPWGVTDVETFLTANTIPFQIYGSVDFATLDFSGCQMVIISSDQPSTFYTAYGEQIDRIEEFVNNGGYLNFFAADLGWNGGILTAPLPGGLVWTPLYEEQNLIDEPAHPVVQGVPSPFVGSFASHGTFSNLPAEAVVIAHGQQSNGPTIVEYSLGSGLVLAFGQPLEIAHSFGWDAGLIMENALLFGRSYAPPDVPWLSTVPITGTISASGSLEIVATFDANVPEVNQPGDYLAELRIADDTPYSMAPIPVVMTVTAPASWGKVAGEVMGLAFCDEPGSPLAAALLEINGLTSFKSRDDGSYSYWMEQGSYSLTISAAGFVTQTLAFTIGAGQTTVLNPEMRRDAPCLSSSLAALNVSLRQGSSTTVDVVLNNSGAADLDYTLLESSYWLPQTLTKLRTPAEAAGLFSQAVDTGPLSVRGLSGIGGQSLLAPESNWFAAADHPLGVVRYGHAQCSETPNSFYVFSGVDGIDGVNTKSWRYDAADNEWTELAPMPQGQEGPTAVCYQGRIYLMGGGGSNQFYVYDIASDDWWAAAPLPRNVWGAAAAAWDGQLYLVGGDQDFSIGDTSAEVNIYDIDADSWVGTGSAMPFATVASGYVQAGEYLYLAGGWDDSSPTANVAASQRYNMVNDVWEVGPALNQPRADLALAMTVETLYAIGGDADEQGFFDASNSVEQLSISDWSGGSWTDSGDPLPAKTSANNAGFCTAGFFPAQVWSVGGLANWSIQGVNRFLGRPAESCFSIYSNVVWLSATPVQGTVAAGGQQTLAVTLDSAALAEGMYQATIVIVSNDRGYPIVNLPVTLIVSNRLPTYLPVIYNK